MELTLNERINFRSYFKPCNDDAWFFRVRQHLIALYKLRYTSEFRIDAPFRVEQCRMFKGYTKGMALGLKK